MLAVALFAALASPPPGAPRAPGESDARSVRVSVEGDEVIVAFVRARLNAAGVVLSAPEQADVRVRLRVVGEGAAHTVRVLVEDRRGVLVDRATDAAGDDADVAAWLAVRDAVERVDLTAPPPSTQPGRLPLPLDVDLLAGAAPDVTFASTSFLPITILAGARFDVAPSLRVVTELGYCAGFAKDTTLHGMPIRLGAELHGGDDLPLQWAAGARASTTPSLAVSGNRAGGGIGAAVAAYGRVTFPMNDMFALVAEAGVESKLVRQTVLTDDGTHEEPLFAAPLAFGMEVRL